MVVKRKKKITKYRGSRTCGWGLVHRGSGQKGGVGNAGSGKKAASKVPKKGLWAKQLMGKHGFIHKGPVQRDKVINLRDLEDKFPHLLAEKLAVQNGNVVTVDLNKAGFTKVLSAGKVTRAWKITAQRASPGAIEKVKAAGGDIVVAKLSKPAAKPVTPARAE